MTERLSIPLYGSDPAKPIHVDGVWPLACAATFIGVGVLVILGGPLFLILTPIVLLLALRFIRTRRAIDIADEVASQARRDLVHALGHDLMQADFHAAPSRRRRGVVATGLAYDGQRLFAIEESVAESIAWAEVRRFRWPIASDNVVDVPVDVHVPGAPAVPDLGARGDARARRAAEAMTQSGFFLHVKDINRPVRQFMTNDRAVLEKWYEILTQMKEGRLAVA